MLAKTLSSGTSVTVSFVHFSSVPTRSLDWFRHEVTLESEYICGYWYISTLFQLGALIALSQDSAFATGRKRSVYLGSFNLLVGCRNGQHF